MIEHVLAYIGFVVLFSAILFFIPRAVLTIVLVCLAIKFNLVDFDGKDILPGINCAIAFVFFAFGLFYDVTGIVLFIEKI